MVSKVNLVGVVEGAEAFMDKFLIVLYLLLIYFVVDLSLSSVTELFFFCFVFVLFVFLTQVMQASKNLTWISKGCSHYAKIILISPRVEGS